MSGNIITSADLIPKATGGIKGAIEGVQGANNGIKDIIELAKQINSAIDKVQTMRGVGQQSNNLNGIDPKAQSHKGEGKIIETVTVVKDPDYDQELIAKQINDLMINFAPMLPDDMKEKQLKDLVGENWKNLKFNFMGKEGNSDLLAQIISQQLIELMKKCKKQN